MKILLSISVMILFGCRSIAQSVTAKKDSGTAVIRCIGTFPRQPDPAYVVKSRGREYLVDTARSVCEVLAQFNPNWIDRIEVIKPSEGAARYMESANSGTIIITLNDKKCPDAFKALKQNLTFTKLSSATQ